MHAFLPHKIFDDTFLLTAHRTIYWEQEKALILSDLHLGKSGHFRKSGIAIPQTIFKDDMQRLMAEIQYYKPEQLIIVGDLFHSKMNKEHDLFMRWRKDLVNVEMHLIKGNHDILKNDWYGDAEITVHDKHYAVRNFTFTHDINECEAGEGNYCFSGHIHPGIYMSGVARQAITLPCFYFAKEYAVLPAFGKFTGTFPIKPARNESVFVLLENKIMQLQ
jgi:DNA ligase-associated metallophosphoesterase